MRRAYFALLFVSACEDPNAIRDYGSAGAQSSGSAPPVVTMMAAGTPATTMPAAVGAAGMPTMPMAGMGGATSTMQAQTLAGGAGGRATSSGSDPDGGTMMPEMIDPAAFEPIVQLSDEFEDATSIGDWLRVNGVEQWGADQLAILNFDTSYQGGAFIRPHTCGWHGDYRGPLVFKYITGDFVVTAHLNATKRDDIGPPQSAFSMAGVMLRAPRNVTPATWTPGGENYVYITLGSSDGGMFQTELKLTAAGASSLEIERGDGPEATVRLARVGRYVIGLIQWPGAGWQVYRRVIHEALPQTLQVGMTAYSDWGGVSTMEPVVYNQQVILTGAPDLDARFDYFRFDRIEVPPSLQDADLSIASEAELLGFLGFEAAE